LAAVHVDSGCFYWRAGIYGAARANRSPMTMLALPLRTGARPAWRMRGGQAAAAELKDGEIALILCV
jgi:hypothetical protein